MFKNFSNNLIISISILSLLLFTIVFAATFIDDTQGEFDSGIYTSNTQWDTDHIELTIGASTGTYTSHVFDGTDSETSWDNIAWSETLLSGEIQFLVDSGSDIWRSSDNGVTWTLSKDRYNGSTSGSEGMIIDNNDYIYVSDNDSVWRSIDLGYSWTEITSMFGDGGNTVSMAIESDGDLYIADVSEDVFRSTDNGSNWILQVSDFNGGNGNIQRMLGVGTSLYAVDNKSDVWGSTDNGVNWTLIKDNYNSSANGADGFAADSSGNLYIIGNDGLWKSTDSGVNWTEIINPFGNGPNAVAMWIDGSNNDIYIADANEDIWRSTNAGLSFTEQASNMNGSTGNIERGASATISTNVTFATRSGSANPPTDSFSGTLTAPTGQDPNVSDSQYFQYQTTFSSNDGNFSPDLSDVTITYSITSDTTAPSAVSDLATSGATSGSIDLDWTAPGDDAGSGTATTYDIRYSTATISEGNWSSATQVTGEPTPSVAGSSESKTVTGLSASTLYYFAIKISDEVPNESSISNIPSLSTSAAADSTAPSAVSDLAASGATSSSIDLDWTAPGDDAGSGTATTYDIRYSTSLITAGNWSSATTISNEPTPSIAGSSESVTVGSLSASTLYYFAIKTSDEVPNESAISNIPSLSTSATADTTAPSAVSDLALSDASDSAITVGWTAPGDDAGSGTATTYDLRYSTSLITAGNWSSATQVSSEPTPSAAGSSESKVVTSLSASTLYYFAIKTSDEVPNESSISNIPSLSTTAVPDTTAPSAVSDLAASGATSGSIDLDWTAPGDDAGSGTATTYDIRYSTATITEGNWSSATQVSSEPSPSVAGSSESKTVTGLSESTLYYFAIKTSDEVPNESSISNITSLSTIAIPDTTAPSAVSDLAASSPTQTTMDLDWTAPGDDAGSGTATTYDIRYSTATITEGNWSSATTISNEPTPSAAGSSESVTINSLSANTTYYFAIKTSDEVPNESSLSNVTINTTSPTPDTTAPSAISDLTASNPSQNSIDLSWTAPGDDAGSGTATIYDIRYSTATITAGNWSSATEFIGEPTPSVAGSSESVTVPNLDSSTTYYFAMKTRDEIPNESDISNVDNETTEIVSISIPTTFSGGVAPTGVSFSGLAYPNSRIIVQSKSNVNPIYNNVPLSTHTISETGEFSVTYAGFLTGQYFFTLQAQDRNNQKTDILSFNVDFRTSKNLTVKDLFLPPTLTLSDSLLKIDETLEIDGYSSPSSEVELEIDDISESKIVSDEDGHYAFDVSLRGFSEGVHYVRVKQTKDDNVSNFTSPRSFKISTLSNPRADFNKDNDVSITDWSVFLYRWGDGENELRHEIDLDDDGDVDIQDFSIFLKAINL